MTEPIDQATKDLIEKGAIKYAQKVGDYTKDFHDGINAKYAYIDGAMVWAEKLKQIEAQSHDQVRIIEHLEEKLKQERNKVIDEAIEIFIAHGFSNQDYRGKKALELLESLKTKVMSNKPINCF